MQEEDLLGEILSSISPEEMARQKREKEAKEAYESERNEMVEIDLSDEGIHSRHRGADWFDEMQKTVITLVGCGGIGSWVALYLARNGVNTIEMYDADKIEQSNIGGQLFGISDIGKQKIDAVSDRIREYAPGCSIEAHNLFFDSGSYSYNICITALDSMSARKLVWQRYKELYNNSSYETKKKCLFVDGRMSMETLSVFAFRMSQDYRVLNYESECLFGDEFAGHQICSAKATTHVGAMIGSIISFIVTNHLRFGDNDSLFNNNVPFFTSVDGENGLKIKTSKIWQRPSVLKK